MRLPLSMLGILQDSFHTGLAAQSSQALPRVTVAAGAPGSASGVNFLPETCVAPCASSFLLS